MQHVEHLGGSLVIVDKRRSSATETSQENLIGGPIEGKTAIVLDDIISTGGSIVGAACVAKQHGARDVYVGAAHGVFCGPALSRLSEADIKEIVVTDSLARSDDPALPNLKVVSTAPLLGEAIRRIHRNESVSYLFD